MDKEYYKTSMTHKTPNKEQLKSIEQLREAYKDLVDHIFMYCPINEKSKKSLEGLEDSLMWAIKSIILP